MRKVLILVLLLGLLAGAMPAAAQDDDCPPDQVRAWLDARTAALDALVALDGQAQADLNMALIVDMQAVRRDFAAQPVPGCALEAAYYSQLLFTNVIDYWIAAQAGETDLAGNIAAQNATLIEQSEAAVTALQDALKPGGTSGGGALGGAAGDGDTAATPAGPVTIAIDNGEGLFSQLNGIAFANGIELAFLRRYEDLADALAQPDYGAFIVTDICRLINWAGEDITTFLANGGHLFIFYYRSEAGCTQDLQDMLNIAVVDDYAWSGNEPDVSPAVWPWLQGIEIGGISHDDSDLATFLVSPNDGFQGFLETRDGEPRLIITTYEYGGGQVTFFPKFAAPYADFVSLLNDELIERHQNQEAALRILQFLSGTLP